MPIRGARADEQRVHIDGAATHPDRCVQANAVITGTLVAVIPRGAAVVTSPTEFINPVVRGEPGQDHGDPFVIRHLDEYFLYHSGGTPNHRGIPVYRSTDLVHWTYEGLCLEPSHDEDAWNWADLWAPEVVYADGVFVMYVTATTERRGRPAAWHEVGPADAYKRHIGIARSASPRGPFVWDGEPLRDDCYTIDGSPFRDVDGSEWLFFVRRIHAGYDPPQVIGIAAQRLVEGRLEGPAVEVASPSEAWERRADGSSIIEGPFVVRRHGRYYAFFSGSGYQERTYGAGYAVADQVTGPWVKYAGNPFWAAAHPVHGPGHFALVLAPDGATPYVVYHG